MPIENYNGNTFVAFTDISGFKVLMKNDQDALKAIRHFYQAGYDALMNRPNVQGFFVSDCGVLFSRTGTTENKLIDLLQVIQDINRRMLTRDYMLTTSIAYGYFNYQDKIEFEGIDKNPIYGGAYLKAYLDNETGSPKIQPGQCRIVKDGIPPNALIDINQLIDKGSRHKHLNYYWNVNNENQITEFEREYSNTYSLKYAGMLKALKKIE